MPLHSKINRFISRFDHLGKSTKASLLFTLIIFAAIPVTIMSVNTYRTFTSHAAGGDTPLNLSPAYSWYNLSPIFTWNCSSCTSTSVYRVYLRTGDGNFFSGTWYKDVTGPSADSGGWKSLSYPAFPGFKYSTTYFWTVALSGYPAAPTTEFTIPLTNSDIQPPSVPVITKYLGPDINHSYKLVLEWNPSTDNIGVTKYEVMRVDGKISAPLITIPANNNVYIDTGVRFGHVYNYQVRAVDAAGNTSAFSPFVTEDLALDSDADGFPDVLEREIGTDPNLGCGSSGISAWPPDFDNNKTVSISELQLEYSKTLTGLYVSRYDLNGDGKVDASDVAIEKTFSFKTCI